MDSPQSVVSPFKSVFAEPDKQINADLPVKNPVSKSKGIEVKGKEAEIHNLEAFIGVLDVYIHEARDIHNICIYQKQDVYAKLFLTTDPENTVSTQIINGGGQNPVFNEHLRFNVRSIDSSLKCEIWMLSRVRNYLEDQLLGFALVPLSEVVLKNGTLNKEFSLSSTDLFHSPAGFVQLSLSYGGSSPEVMAIPAPATTEATDTVVLNSKVSEFDKIEFPDPNVVNENDMMVSEYYGIPCTNLDSHSSESLVSSDTENRLSSKGDEHNVENPSKGPIDPAQILRPDPPPSSVSTNESPSVSLPASCHSSDTPSASKSTNEECSLLQKENTKEKTAETGGGESDAFIKPVVSVTIEPEQKVVQQDYVDMYMKSLQQFTESLAKMKLPLDIESGQTSSTDSSSDQKSQTPKSAGSRVFYGSRAFF